MGADCKSAGYAYEGSNPSPATSRRRSERVGAELFLEPPTQTIGNDLDLN
jgi:hypothetical protein